MEFNPQMTYQWDRDANITISGMDFNILLGTIKAIASTRTPSELSIETMMSIGSCYTILTEKLVEMVESGIAKEPQKRTTTLEPTILPD